MIYPRLRSPRSVRGRSTDRRLLEPGHGSKEASERPAASSPPRCRRAASAPTARRGRPRAALGEARPGRCRCGSRSSRASPSKWLEALDGATRSTVGTLVAALGGTCRAARAAWWPAPRPVLRASRHQGRASRRASRERQSWPSTCRRAGAAARVLTAVVLAHPGLQGDGRWLLAGGWLDLRLHATSVLLCDTVDTLPGCGMPPRHAGRAAQNDRQRTTKRINRHEQCGDGPAQRQRLAGSRPAIRCWKPAVTAP